jgi:hypothetical protein
MAGQGQTLLSVDDQQYLDDRIVDSVARAQRKFVSLILDAGQCMGRSVKVNFWQLC